MRVTLAAAREGLLRVDSEYNGELNLKNSLLFLILEIEHCPVAM